MFPYESIEPTTFFIKTWRIQMKKSLNMNDIRRICFYDSLSAARWDELDSQNDENQWNKFEI